MYYRKERRDEKQQLLLSCAVLAEKLAMAQLATDIQTTYENISSIPHPEYSVLHKLHSFDIHPRSYQKRLLPMLGKVLYKITKRLK